MGQSVSEYLNGIQSGLINELTTHKAALPAGFNKERFTLNCVTMIQDMLKDYKKKEALEKVNPQTIPVCLAKGAYLGLDFFNGECYAIPYGKSMEFQTDYKGEVKLCKRYSKNPIKDIYAKVVREGDLFEEEIDRGLQNIRFKPKPFSNADMIGAFAVAVFKDGSMIYDTMSKDEIESVRKNYSKAQNSKAWTNSTGEMYKKTVLRRLCKMIDLDFDSIEQRKAFDAGGDADMEKNVIEATNVRTVGMQDESLDPFKNIDQVEKRPQIESKADPIPKQNQEEPFMQQSDFGLPDEELPFV